jgi:hypothetical protein
MPRTPHSISSHQGRTVGSPARSGMASGDGRPRSRDRIVSASTFVTTRARQQGNAGLIVDREALRFVDALPAAALDHDDFDRGPSSGRRTEMTTSFAEPRRSSRMRKSLGEWRAGTVRSQQGLPGRDFAEAVRRAYEPRVAPSSPRERAPCGAAPESPVERHRGTVVGSGTVRSSRAPERLRTARAVVISSPPVDGNDDPRPWLSVAAPCYNEADGIAGVVAEWDAVLAAVPQAERDRPLQRRQHRRHRRRARRAHGALPPASGGEQSHERRLRARARLGDRGDARHVRRDDRQRRTVRPRRRGRPRPRARAGWVRRRHRPADRQEGQRAPGARRPLHEPHGASHVRHRPARHELCAQGRPGRRPPRAADRGAWLPDTDGDLRPPRGAGYRLGEHGVQASRADGRREQAPSGSHGRGAFFAFSSTCGGS